MAVIVTDRRTTLTEADATTGFNTGTAVTSFFAEATGCVAVAYNPGTGQTYFSFAATDLSDTLMYVYSFNNALQNPWDTAANPPNAFHVGSTGPIRATVWQAGSDRRRFSHSDGPTEWQCFVVDGSMMSTLNTQGLVTMRQGAFGSLNLANTILIGADHTTLSKALAGGYNTAVDIIRYGNDGLRITGGTTGSRGNFLEIAIEDRSTANLKAHGILRELTAGVYGCQGPLTWGNTTGVSWFEAAGVVLAFEDVYVADDKFYLATAGGAGGGNETHFILRDVTISTGGPGVRCDFSSGDVNTLQITGTLFSGLLNTISFATDTAGQSHVVSGCVFSGCGRIDPGVVQFTANTISNSTDADGAVLLDADGTGEWGNLEFVSGGTGHAIIITAAGTYTFSNFTYSGYGANDTTNASVYNNSGGAVTIKVSGGDNPTVRNGTGATTTVVNAVDYVVTGMVIDSELTIVRVADEAVLFHVENTATGTETYSHDGTSTPVDVLVMNVDYVPVAIEDTIGSSNQSLLVQQIIDRVYSNPSAPPPPPPANILEDDFTGTNGDPWDATEWTTGQQSGTVDIQSNRGRLQFTSSASASARGFSVDTAEDSEVLLKWQYDGASTVGGFLRIGLRSSTDASAVTAGIPDGNSYYVQFRSRIIGGDRGLYRTAAGVPTQIVAHTFQPTLLTDQWTRFRVDGSDIKVRWWADGDPEPGTWNIEETDTNVTGAGRMFVIWGREAGGPFDALIDDVVWSNLP